MQYTISIIILTVSCTIDGAWDFLMKMTYITQLITGYDHRIKVVIDNSSQNETLINFPVLIVLNPGRISYSNISPDGSG